MNETMRPIPQNYKKQVEWVFKAYESAGVDLPNGFQKDDIQNHQGARKTNRWNNWKSDISLIENEKGVFLVCEDEGTVGLTGDNISTDEINELVAADQNLDPDQRLARFTSMNNSGGNKTGGGLYGVGKVVYSVASEDYIYYFDSLREDGKYVANMNNNGQVYNEAKEGEEAKKFIKDNTGLDEKKNVGTRVIIKNPKKELVEAIETGKMEKYIQESWWLIIDRLPENAAISLNGNPIKVPDGIKETNHKFELESPLLYKPGYRVKKFGFYLFEDGDNEWEGIAYYRKGMKIGYIDITDIPEKLRGKFWGYIEVDEEWEDALAEIEDAVHFGVIKRKKLTNQYQHLKNFCGEQVRSLLIEWGFIKDKENEDQKLKEELKQIAEDVQDLFDSLGFEDLGKGPQKSDFDVRWKNIKYPVEDSLSVTTDDNISFTMRINSSYLTDKKIEYSLKVIDQYTKEVRSVIDAKTITLKANSIYENDYSFVVSKENSTRYNENRIVLNVKIVGSGKEKVKELPFFYDCEKPDDLHEKVILSLHECEFPVEGSRRVNFDEKISNISYRIDNKRQEKLSYRLNISVHNASDSTCPEIAKIATINGIIKPFEEEIISDIPDIIFDKEYYSQYLEEGILQLRARLIAMEDCGEYRKGDKITNYTYDIYLNQDEKNGKRDAFEIKSIERPDSFKRSWYEKSGNDRAIVLNIGHNAYLRLADYDDVQHEYLFEQVLKQYVLLYLAEGKYDMFKTDEEDFQELDPVTAASIVIDKIEDVFYKSVK